MKDQLGGEEEREPERWAWTVRVEGVERERVYACRYERVRLKAGGKRGREESGTNRRNRTAQLVNLLQPILPHPLSAAQIEPKRLFLPSNLRLRLNDRLAFLPLPQPINGKPFEVAGGRGRSSGGPVDGEGFVRGGGDGVDCAGEGGGEEVGREVGWCVEEALRSRP